MPIPVVKRSIGKLESGHLVWCGLDCGYCASKPAANHRSSIPSWFYDTGYGDRWRFIQMPMPVISRDWRRSIVRFEQGSE